MNLLNHQFFPRLVFFPFYLAWILSLPIALFKKVLCRNRRNESTKLVIEAGVGGWDIIEYKELYQTAVEYLCEEEVVKLMIDKEESYVKQVHKAIKKFVPTHYAYSPRTGSQFFFKGLYESFNVFLLLFRKGIIPIVFLTDLPIRRWRAQSAVITARNGTVVTLMSPGLFYPIFPHKRVIGPYIMPFSEKTLTTQIQQLIEKYNHLSISGPLFTGALYEPRKTKLKNIQLLLKEREIDFHVQGRELGGKRSSDEVYWERLVSAGIVVTTADQILQKGTDWQWMPHFVYRYMEVLACGSLLVAPNLPGISRYFVAGEHFVSFESEAEAVEKIHYYYNNDVERRRIALRGKERADMLVSTKSFWSGIDVVLGKEHIKN
jgi:hypothetical protein